MFPIEIDSLNDGFTSTRVIDSINKVDDVVSELGSGFSGVRGINSVRPTSN